MIKSIVPVGLLIFVASAAVACSGKPSPSASNDSDGPVRANASRIVGGVTDTADPAVVAFEATGNDGGDCTAEFISTTVLVTAAHCVLTENGQPLTGATFRIAMKNDFSQIQNADWINIPTANVHANPAYDGNDNDIAVLVLPTPAAVTPLAYSVTPLTQSIVSQSVRLVGYGSNKQGTAASGNNGGFGLKRQITTTVDDLQTGFVHIGKTGANGCDGDSGGPALVMIGGVETLVAIDSYGDQSIDCTGGDYYQRLDTQAAFIAQYLTAAPATDAGADAGSSSTPSTSTPGTPSTTTTSGGTSGTSDPSSSGSDDDSTTQASTGGCSLARTSNADPRSLFAPFAAALALVALRRRRR